jgi:hypothetical protein
MSNDIETHQPDPGPVTLVMVRNDVDKLVQIFSFGPKFWAMFRGEPAPMHGGTWYFHLSEWGLLVAILSSKNVRFELRGPDLV